MKKRLLKASFFIFEKKIVKFKTIKPFIILLLFLSCNKKEQPLDNILNNNYEKAWSLMQSNKDNDSAFYYFNVAKQNYEDKGYRKGIGKCYLNGAIIQANSGDYFGSEESCILALKYFNESEDSDYIVSVYNAIAISRSNLGDYKSALIWYKKSLKSSSDSLEKVTIRNNIAIAYSRLGYYNQSTKVFENLLKSGIFNQDEIVKARILDNIAFTKYLQNKNYNAKSQLNKALTIRENENDLFGQNASHAHLSDYFKQKNPEKSLFHAHKMFQIAKEINSPDDQIEALQKLVNLENPTNSKKYFKTYLNLNDSLQTARNKAKNQFALVRYEAEKNQADFLKAKAENIEKNYQLLLRNIIIGLSILVFILIIVWVFKRQKRVQQEKKLLIQEKELEVKNTELKYSKKVHDVVSNGVYQIMSEIENTDEINKDKILNKLELIYEKSRDISYENLSENILDSYKTKISQLVNSFNSESLKCIIVGNDENLWRQVSTNIKSEILVILQELLVNFKKHSKAKKVKLAFEKIENQLHINYMDDGIGLGANFHKKNGLQNTESRIISCQGCINFEQTTEKGTTINISFPLNNL